LGVFSEVSPYEDEKVYLKKCGIDPQTKKSFSSTISYSYLPFNISNGKFIFLNIKNKLNHQRSSRISAYKEIAFLQN
jgi:hypothetical protein